MTLPDLQLVWPDQGVSRLHDISESGLLVPSSGLLGQVKLGQAIEVKIRREGREAQTLHVKVLRLTAHFILLSLDSLTLTGRLKLGQEDRENLITASWRPLPARFLHPSFQGAEWWHSAFDSNIWIWRDSAGVAEKVAVEFESVALVYDSQGTRYLKAPSAFDEVKGYAGPLLEPLPHKVEPGHNWFERLRKILSGPLPPELVAEVLAHVPRSGARAPHV